ncbi:MAG: hypothetical protein HY748_09050 [Elusimicrobia bacterium]|nr:hypothetical protein [Elusimicrobiota bacterium]
MTIWEAWAFSSACARRLGVAGRLLGLDLHDHLGGLGLLFRLCEALFEVHDAGGLVVAPLGEGFGLVFAQGFGLGGVLRVAGGLGLGAAGPVVVLRELALELDDALGSRFELLPQAG